MAIAEKYKSLDRPRIKRYNFGEVDEMGENKKIFYIDFLRSFAIIMVLALHSISGYIVVPKYYGSTSWYVYLVINAISRTGVPVFFMISGYLMLNSDLSRDLRSFYKRRIPRLLIPLAAWNIIYFVFGWAVSGKELSLGRFMGDILNSGTEYHLWYLYTLIGLYLLVPFIKIIVDKCNTKQLVWLEFLILLCTTLRPLINTVSPYYVYLFEPLFTGYSGFFLLGYILAKVRLDKKRLFGFLAAGISGMALSVFGHHLASSDKGIDLIFNYGYSICHYLLAAAIFVFARHFCRENGKFGGVFGFISKVSLGIYLIHAAVMDIVTKYFMIDASPVISSVYIFVLTAVISAALSAVLGKIKYIRKIIA